MHEEGGTTPEVPKPGETAPEKVVAAVGEQKGGLSQRLPGGLALWIAGVVGLVVMVLVVSFSWGDNGSLGAIVDPSGPMLPEVYAEVEGRSLAAKMHAGLLTRLEQTKEVGIRSTTHLPDAQDLSAVRYTVKTGGTLADISRIFGMPLESLQTLNPTLSTDHFFGPGSKVVLYKPGVALSSVKVGTPNKLARAVPLMDGPGRRILRRSRSWGTGYLIRNLDRALAAYGSAYPDGPVVIVSDISRREGGRLKPHHTHREGRDVDMSYVPKPAQDNGGFMKMNDFAFDRERNWTFLKALIDTGSVRRILMDYSLQRMLYKHLEKKGVSEAQLRRIFQYPRERRAEVGLIRHWEGHRDHMHVRFSCDPTSVHCKE